MENSKMSADPVIIPTKTTIKPGQTFVAGKVDSNRKYDGKHYTRLVQPAADEYSSPSYIEIESDRKLDDVDNVWRGLVCLRGYRNDYTTKDGEKVKAARNVLVAVE